MSSSVLIHDLWVHRKYPQNRRARQWLKPVPQTADTFLDLYYWWQIPTKSNNASQEGERFEHCSENVRLTKISSLVFVYQSQADSETNGRYTPGVVSGFDE